VVLLLGWGRVSVSGDFCIGLTHLQRVPLSH
jgi:hypothetical protein